VILRWEARARPTFAFGLFGRREVVMRWGREERYVQCTPWMRDLISGDPAAREGSRYQGRRCWVVRSRGLCERSSIGLGFGFGFGSVVAVVVAVVKLPGICVDTQSL